MRTTFRPTTRYTADADNPPTPTPTAGRVELTGRTPRSMNTVEGWVALILGLPFVGAGVAVAALAAGKLETVTARGRNDFPPAALLAIGLSFPIVGLSIVLGGVRGILRRRAEAALRARYPGQPWMADFPWDRLGGRDELPADGWRALWFAAFLLLFLVPFHWVAFYSAERPTVFRVVTLIFDLVAVALIGRALYLAARRVRYGASRLGFSRFPIRPGTTAELLLGGVSPLARARPMRATLRCVEERYEVRTSGSDRQRTTTCYETYRDETTVPPGEPCVRFAIPEGVPTTTLAARPPRYWELELRAEAPGVDYGARFLVPVYE